MKKNTRGGPGQWWSVNKHGGDDEALALDSSREKGNPGKFAKHGNFGQRN